MTHTPANNECQKQANTTKPTLSTFQAYKHQRYPPTVHTHTHTPANMQATNQPTQQSEADNFSSTTTLASMLPSKVSSHCMGHLAKCQVGLKVSALPHTRPTVRHSTPNCHAGLRKAPQFTPHAVSQTTTNQHNQAIHKVNTPLLQVRQKTAVTTEVPYDGFVTTVKES